MIAVTDTQLFSLVKNAGFPIIAWVTNHLQKLHILYSIYYFTKTTHHIHTRFCKIRFNTIHFHLKKIWTESVKNSPFCSTFSLDDQYPYLKKKIKLAKKQTPEIFIEPNSQLNSLKATYLALTSLSLVKIQWIFLEIKFFLRCISLFFNDLEYLKN